jgi:hypothetical protein
MSTILSAVLDLEQQLTRAYALVASARDALLHDGAKPDSIPIRLLDMAEDELSDLRLIKRVEADVAV